MKLNFPFPIVALGSRAVRVFALGMLLCSLQMSTQAAEFRVSFSPAVHSEPVTGRLFVLVSRINDPEVRLQSHWINGPQIFAKDVQALRPDQPVIIDSSVEGTPFTSLSQMPAGEYYIQSVLSLYTEFHRADGHTVRTHMDQWEGQRFNSSPGNLYSRVSRVNIDPSARSSLKLQLTEVIQPIHIPADTEWVKYVKIQSNLLTAFWGRPIYLGAIVLLPKGYDSHPDRRYPVVYDQQGHFAQDAPFGFSTTDSPEKKWDRRERERAGYETGYQFYRSWNSEHIPRMIAVTFQHATPFSDMSGVRNSVNNGPYGDAIMSELIPYIEEHFRIISESSARFLTGKASGGRDALTLQLLHPEFFGGAWIFHPWAFTFRSFFNLNIYENSNAFEVPPSDVPEWARNPSAWFPLERYLARIGDGTPLVTMRQMSQHDAVLGGMCPGGEFGTDDAILSPVGADGYPERLWDRKTGQINRAVAAYWQEHGDLQYFAERNWPTIGPQLVGKLHFYAGDMDHFQRNYGVHMFQKFLETTTNPYYAGTFEYGQLAADWQPMTNAELIEIMAGVVLKHASSIAGKAMQD